MRVEMKDGLLAHLDAKLIAAAYAAAPGNEFESGKFASPESSAALVANAFGYFIAGSNAGLLPEMFAPAERVRSVQLETSLRFPWTGGLHPWLDAVLETDGTLIGIESKRYEPVRPKRKSALSDAYWRPVWGSDMRGYEAVRDRLRSGDLAFSHLDAAQLIKHALGLFTQSTRRGRAARLFYLYAEPLSWADGRPIPDTAWSAHRAEVAAFSRLVAGDAVEFCHGTWRQFVDGMLASADAGIRDHAKLVERAFAPL